MAERIPQSVAYTAIFKAYLLTTGLEATGVTIAITISKNTAAFGNPSVGATNATEISGGWYYVTLSTTDTGTVGPLAVRGTSATIQDVGIALTVANDAATTATAIWQDATAGDFTVASSIGKSLYTSGVVPGGTNGLFIAGTNAATTITTALTTTFTGNLTGSVASVVGAVGSVTGAVGSVTGAVGSVTGNVTGSVGSVLGGVTVTTNNDKTGYALSASYDFATGTAAMTESYAANGVAPTPVQAIMAIHQMLMDFSISGTSITVKQLNNSSTAYVVTINSATAPTAAART